MQGLLIIVILAAAVCGIGWLAVVVRNRFLRKPNLSAGKFIGAALATALAPLIALEVAVIVWASLAYDGTCFGFTDGQWPCERIDYVTAQASWGLFIAIILAVALVPAVAIIFGLGWRRRSRTSLGE